MIMFDFVDADYKESVFLPEKNIYLSFVYNGHLDKHFLCMESCKNSKISTLARFHRYGIRPVLYNYKALPYKRQSTVNRLNKNVFLSRIYTFGLPWTYDYESLNKIKSFHSNCKKHYIVIAYPLSNKEEKVLFTFDRYCDAISLLRDFGYSKIRNLLGSDFETYNSWYPYLWVEYMDHPISLLSEVGSHMGSHFLGPVWCDYLLSFLRNGFVCSDSFKSVFGCVHKGKFSRIINWDSKQ